MIKFMKKKTDSDSENISVSESVDSIKTRNKRIIFQILTVNARF